MDEKKFLILGRIKAPVGVKGDLRVTTSGDRTGEFNQIATILVDGVPYELEYAHSAMQQKATVIHLKGIDDRTKAFELCGKEVAVSWEHAPKLKEGTYYIRDLIGLSVWNEQMEMVGTVINVQMGLQNLFEIAKQSENEKGKTFLVPNVKYYVENVDIQDGKLHLKHIEDLMNLS